MYKNGRITFVGLIASLIFAASAAGCDTDRDTAPGPEVGRGNVSVADITSNWTNYDGRTVTVVADVEEVLGPRAFKLDEDAPLRGGVDDDLLVLSPQAGNLANIDDQWLNNKVRVTGTVRRFVAANVEREIGWDLNPQLEIEYEGKRPVLIATSVERVR